MVIIDVHLFCYLFQNIYTDTEMEKLRELLSQLNQTEERHVTLEGIKPALSSLSRKEAEDGLKVLIGSLSEFFYI